VGWANSSLRPVDGLPPLPPEATRSARGVVLEDPLPAAWARDEWEALQRRAAGRAAAAAATGAARRAGAGGGGGGDGAGAAGAGPEPQGHEASRLYGAASPAGAAAGGGAGGRGDSWHALRSGASDARQASGSGEEDWAAAGDGDWAEGGAPGGGWGAEARGYAVAGGPGQPGGLGGARQLASVGGGGAAEAAAVAAAAAGSRGFATGREEQQRRGPVDALGAAEAVSAEADLQAGLSGRGARAPPARAAQPQAGRAQQGPAAGGAPGPDSRAERVAVMLERLASLPWRRVDVSFEGATFGLGERPPCRCRKGGALDPRRGAQEGEGAPQGMRRPAHRPNQKATPRPPTRPSSPCGNQRTTTYR
jgi:hypothetical protein